MHGIDPQRDRLGYSNDVLRALSGIRGELEHRPIDDILDDLPGQMARVQGVMREASEAIRLRFFPSQADPVWVGEIS